VYFTYPTIFWGWNAELHSGIALFSKDTCDAAFHFLQVGL